MNLLAYSTFRAFDAVAHTVFDLLYCILAYLQIRYVQKIGRKEFMRWIYPGATSCGLTLIYRAAYDYKLLMGTHWPLERYVVLSIWLEIADIASLIGSLVFVRMMLAGELFGPVLGQRPAVDDEAWPPPPSQSRPN